MLAAMVCEVVMTMMFLIVILGSTDKRAPAGFAPLAVGLCLTLIDLISGCSEPRRLQARCRAR